MNGKVLLRPPAFIILALSFALVPASAQDELTVSDFKSTKPAPRTGDGHPDLSGYWKGTRETKPVGNIAKDLPGLKLPLTSAGEAAWKRNVTATIDPESLCIIGGIPRHKASALPFEILQGSHKIAFLYLYTYYRLIPVDPQRKHSEDPDPSFFGEELGRWDGDGRFGRTELADMIIPRRFRRLCQSSRASEQDASGSSIRA